MTSQPPPQTRFTAEVVLRWGDMDAYGHVNNVQYHRLLEEARIRAFSEWFHASGGDSMLRSGVLLARQEIEFLEQLAYRPEPVAIEMWVTHLGGASWDMGYEIRDEDALYARAESTMVAFDLAAQRPRSLSEDERAALTALLDAPVAMRRRR
ncbi:thioesterase [Janibacter sp. Soil728]|uniref:acyl-CoA thioesterase n=1 Tax=Janibacter sp. Soil728 TaxID=1736393 RepID=UPI0006FA0511|nr:thioesterase family protein [Janibacter sp. Soil728]KRE37804.1 thioesterase [Janibacter sp. Soil728]